MAYFQPERNRPRAPESADGQPDAQPTNRRINRHKTAAKILTVFCQWGRTPWKPAELLATPEESISHRNNKPNVTNKHPEWGPSPPNPHAA